jgi:phosphinothricin acetyltransferase
MTALTIRLATADDLAAINAIHNHYIETSTATYLLEPQTSDSRAVWFVKRSDAHPVTVALIDGRVVGWGSLSAFNARPAYGRTVENAVYVHPDHHRRGIGSALLSDLIERARTLGHHAIIALIDSEQPASIALHAAAGFTHAGRLHQVGWKFQRWLDVVFMEKTI